MLTVAAARSVRAKLHAVDVVDRELAEAGDDDLDAAVERLDAAAARAAWVDVAALPGRPPRVAAAGVSTTLIAGAVVVAWPAAGPSEKRRGAARVAALERRFALPGGREAFCAATELADRADWVDGAAGPAGPVFAVVLEAGPPARLSLRRSRLAAARGGGGGDALARDGDPAVGAVRPGFVVRADKKAGVFVELARGVVGRVLLKDLADGYVDDVEASFPPGRLVAPVVTAGGPRPELSLRPSAIRREGAAAGRRVEAGDVVTGTVTRVEAYGCFVRLDDAAADAPSGLAHKSELADDFVKDPTKRFTKGDRVKARVLKVDEPAEAGGRRKVSLGLKPSYHGRADNGTVLALLCSLRGRPQ